ncbi:hypothetical protein ACFLQ2_05495 [archaeon]
MQEVSNYLVPPRHPEIEHIVQVLGHVRDHHLQGYHGSVKLKLNSAEHKKGAKRLRNASNLDTPALAIYEASKDKPKGVPNFIKNYFEDPGAQKAFKVLTLVSTLDTSALQNIRRTPHKYGPKA